MNNKKQSSELDWEEVSREHIVKDEYIDFRKSEFKMPNGKIYGPYYTYSRRDYCVIVAYDTEGRFLCVKQYRQGIGRVTTEFPAGGIERKDGKQYRLPEERGDRDFSSAEDALEAAKRELLEETGYESDEWEHLITIPSNATIADNYAHIFLAGNCRKVSGQDLDEMEFLNVEKYTKDEIEAMISVGSFEQATHVMSWLLALRKL